VAGKRGLGGSAGSMAPGTRVVDGGGAGARVTASMEGL
jgi:hypothetical protein